MNVWDGRKGTVGMHGLIATDGSEQSIAAARFWTETIKPADVQRVTVMAVVRSSDLVPFISGASAGISQEVWDSLVDAAQSEANEAITKTVALLGNSGAAVETLVRTGSPADEIVQAAQELHAELIVVGSRGWGPVRSVFLGSVSERIMHLAHCAVLVVRPEHIA